MCCKKISAGTKCSKELGALCTQCHRWHYTAPEWHEITVSWTGVWCQHVLHWQVMSYMEATCISYNSIVL